MRFWDISAVVPLLVRQERTERSQELYKQDADILLWWGTEVECTGAIARLVRDKKLDSAGEREAFDRLSALLQQAHEIQPSSKLKQIAKRLLRAHELRAADSLQLAAALIAHDSLAGEIAFVCFDEQLCTAAQREGLLILTAPMV